MNDWFRRIVEALKDLPRELAEGPRKAKREVEYRRELLEKMRALNEACKDPNWVPPETKRKSKFTVGLAPDDPLRKGIFVMHGFKMIRPDKVTPKKAPDSGSE